MTADVAESGTHLDTVLDPDARTRRLDIEARDPHFTWLAFEARVRHVFTELQPAWSGLDLPRARPYLSDNLFQTWMFWIDTYRKAGLRNVSENARVTGLRLEVSRLRTKILYDGGTHPGTQGQLEWT